MSTQHTITQLSPRALGAVGETLAGAYLQRCGYRILAKNWRSRAGELDLIVVKGVTVVAVEVKTRRGKSHGSPLEAITPEKVHRLRRLLAEWLSESSLRFASVRIDGIGITLHQSQAPELEHIEGIS